MKNNKKTTKTEVENTSKQQLHIKDTVLKLYNFAAFLTCGISAYVFWFNGDSMLHVLAVLLAVLGSVHAYKLVAVVK